MTSEKTASLKKFIADRATLLLTITLVIGICLMAYPSVSDWWNSFHQTQAIAEYSKKVANMDQSSFDRMIEEAEAYNASLVSKKGRFVMSEAEKEEYKKVLDITGNGIMAYIDIPKINVSLPIYHGVDQQVLQVAIGHIEGSSLPVGGKGTHCAVSGHRGLPAARLFTDLDQLEVGDKFLVQILDRTLTYEVDQIRIVLPKEYQDLEIDPDKDLMTLITCTPYRVNSHRLLVRGHRVENEIPNAANITADALLFRPYYVAPIVAAPILLILLIMMLITTSSGYRQRRAAARRRAFAALMHRYQSDDDFAEDDDFSEYDLEDDYFADDDNFEDDEIGEYGFEDDDMGENDLEDDNSETDEGNHSY